MKSGPNIALVASLVGEPARANMLTALMSGAALTATELAQEAGVTLPTASGHLSKLQDGGLLVTERQGRHRYFRLADVDVAEALEKLMGIAARAGHVRTRTGPRDPALRRARVCYDHLAGDLGVALYDGLRQEGYLSETSGNVDLTRAGARFLAGFGIDLEELRTLRRPLCRTCLDWSARRSHLAGSIGAALLARFYALEWAHRATDSRIVVFSSRGERELRRRFGLDPLLS